ncbi:MAG: hypothetical protein HY092_02650, partial [Candidatus Kerfeldbacteria bacterium]|nr:hypothetical protein [Candidatus Kerfeldbacteria bacterium]
MTKTVMAGLAIALLGQKVLPATHRLPGLVGVAALMGLTYIGLLFLLRIVKPEDF